jgi:peroxiredoxin
VDQREVAERLHLPFPLLSDFHLELATALSLPTFRVESMTLLKRMTMILHSSVVEHVFYPIFPPDRDAAQVIAWLKQQREADGAPRTRK